jgi:hypothetical protein
MSASSDSATATAVDGFRKAIDSYRSIAKWVVSSFGAVAAALVVGLPLTSLGELHDLTLVGAILCVVVVLAAILFVIRTASRVLEPLPPVDRADLAKGIAFFKPLDDFIEKDASVLGWDDVRTAAQLSAKYDGRRKEKKDAWKPYAREPGNTVKQKAYENADKAAEEVRERLDLLVTFGSTLRMEQLYRQAMNKTYAAIAVAGAVAIVFACLSSSPADADSDREKAIASSQAPINVKVGGPRLLDWPRSCARLYFAVDKLAAAEPRVGPLWPKGSLSPWDRKCGLENRADVQRALEFLGRTVAQRSRR